MKKTNMKKGGGFAPPFVVANTKKGREAKLLLVTLVTSVLKRGKKGEDFCSLGQFLL
jgi:hypothetical protein